MKVISTIAAIALAVSPLASLAAESLAPATLPGAPELDEKTASELTVMAGPRIMMLRLYVADLDRAEKFYHAVFGANVLQRNTDTVRMMMFPGQSLPGLVLIKSPEEAQMNGSFIIQVADMDATVEKALANGGEAQGQDYAQQMGAAAGKSSHFYDPDGNLIEALQISM